MFHGYVLNPPLMSSPNLYRQQQLLPLFLRLKHFRAHTDSAPANTSPKSTSPIFHHQRLLQPWLQLPGDVDQFFIDRLLVVQVVSIGRRWRREISSWATNWVPPSAGCSLPWSWFTTGINDSLRRWANVSALVSVTGTVSLGATIILSLSYRTGIVVPAGSMTREERERCPTTWQFSPAIAGAETRIGVSCYWGHSQHWWVSSCGLPAIVNNIKTFSLKYESLDNWFKISKMFPYLSCGASQKQKRKNWHCLTISPYDQKHWLHEPTSKWCQSMNLSKACRRQCTRWSGCRVSALLLSLPVLQVGATITGGATRLDGRADSRIP